MINNWKITCTNTYDRIHIKYYIVYSLTLSSAMSDTTKFYSTCIANTWAYVHFPHTHTVMSYAARPVLCTTKEPKNKRMKLISQNCEQPCVDRDLVGFCSTPCCRTFALYTNAQMRNAVRQRALFRRRSIVVLRTSSDVLRPAHRRSSCVCFD